MVSVTIVGAGVTGMTIASQLPGDWKITIVGTHLPGDAPSNDYASNWAGACWVGVPDSSPRDQKLQLDSYAGLYKTATEYPNSGLRISEVTEVMEHGDPDVIWFRSKVKGFRYLQKQELPQRATWGMKYKSIIISPPVFLEWLHSRLVSRGVRFLRKNIKSFQELKFLGHDILINATGAQSKHLPDVADASLIPYRLQSIVVKKEWDQGFIYRGRDGFYFNIFGRPDGTCYIGGFKDLNLEDRTVYDSQRSTILARGHEVLPKIMTSTKSEDYEILYDIATSYYFRPQKDGGTRVQKEIIGDQKIIHAYGQEAGGFTNSFGVAREVLNLALEYAYEMPVQSRI